MSQLFLTSNLPPVFEKLVTMLPQPSVKKSVAFIPTAGFDIERPSEPDWIHTDRELFSSFGFNVSVVNISDYTKENLHSELQKHDILFVSGGNTFYLLQEMRKSGFDSLLPGLLENSKIYIGASAGSVVLAPDIELVQLFDDISRAPDLKNTKGLNLINFMPMVHFGIREYKRDYMDAFSQFYELNYPAVIIHDNQFMHVSDGKFQIISA